jgi:DNA-binding response OmpR family regulator
MKKIKILLAEDETSLGLIIKESLESRNFEVVYCENGEIAHKKYLESNPEILVLDVMMPIMDGFTLAKEIRKKDKNIPIIFLTAKSQTQDVVDGFEIGCNDYIKKPFSMEELIVRIKSLLKRDSFQANESINLGKYKYNFNSQTIEINNIQEVLTHKFNQILKILVANKGQIVERKEILEKIWGSDDYFSGRSMDVYITQLRKKLTQDPSIQIINIRGQGYKMVF